MRGAFGNECQPRPIILIWVAHVNVTLRNELLDGSDELRYVTLRNELLDGSDELRSLLRCLL